jgi:precorrin-2 dehydrogenase/sirohydrochlorin ferrochelatase
LVKSYYPVFLDLAGRPCVVVGGGKVAERKVLGLLRAGARVKVVSPGLTGRLQREKDRGAITHTARPFRKGDLRGAFLVMAATDSREENQRISAAAPALVNVVDTPELCNFIVPSTVGRGPLTIAVSTSGTSPAMARAIRKDLEALYPPAFGKYLKKVAGLRAKAGREMKDAKKRQRYLKSLASQKTIDALRKGRKPPDSDRQG